MAKYQVEIISVPTGEPIKFPRGTDTYNILEETDDDDNVQLACIVERDEGLGVA